MKDLFGKTFLGMLIVLASILALSLAGCEGKDTKKTISDTVERVMSGDAVKKGEEMKKQVDDAMKEEARRLLKMEKDTKGDKGEESSQ